MLQQQIDAILKAEAAARRIVAEAEQQAQSLIGKVKLTRAQVLEERRETARQNARAMVAQAQAAAQEERATILSQADAKAEHQYTQPVDDAFVAEAVARIAGLAP
ncbi:MAG: hypothetical protein IT368_16555 [Candidatus Hydrogenedentes bacterium]|nr:hypothetical protein [Candidatus Hydrogenedentota bacterium]